MWLLILQIGALLLSAALAVWRVCGVAMPWVWRAGATAFSLTKFVRPIFAKLMQSPFVGSLVAGLTSFALFTGIAVAANTWLFQEVPIPGQFGSPEGVEPAIDTSISGAFGFISYVLNMKLIVNTMLVISTHVLTIELYGYMKRVVNGATMRAAYLAMIRGGGRR